MHLHGEASSPGHRTRHGAHGTDVLAPPALGWPKSLPTEWLSLMDTFAHRPHPLFTAVTGYPRGRNRKWAGCGKSRNREGGDVESWKGQEKDQRTTTKTYRCCTCVGASLEDDDAPEKFATCQDYKNGVKSWKPRSGRSMYSVQRRFALFPS